MMRPLQSVFIWHSYLIIGVCGLLAGVWPAPATCAALLLLFFDRRLWPPQRLALSLAVFFCALVFARVEISAANIAQRAAPGRLAKKERICANVQSTRGLPGERLQILLRNVEPENGEPLPGLCSWTWEKPLFQPLKGQRICVSRQVKPVNGFANHERDSFEISFFARKIYWRIWSRGEAGQPQASGKASLAAVLREDLRRAFLRVLWPAALENSEENIPMPQNRAVLMALLFGDRQFLERNTANLFASATLAHSLALSGQHLGIAVLAGSLFIAVLAFVKQGLYLRKSKISLVLAAGLPFAAAYLWLGDSPASLQRAAGMLAFAALWLWSGRRASLSDLLCSTLFVILVCNPLAVFDAGLQMSALCVAVILLSWPAVSNVLKKGPMALESRKRRWARIIFQLLTISFVVQIALLPLSLARFQLAGFWFPLNLLWLPCLGLIVLPFAFIGLFLAAIPSAVCHALADLAVAVAALPCEFLLGLLHELEKAGLMAEPAFMLPHWTAMLGFAALAPALACVWSGSARQGAARGMLFAALCLLAAGPALRFAACFDQKPVLEALDTGQSQAILVSLPGSIRFLVDGGGSYYNTFDPGKMIVAPYLLHNQAPRLSAVFNSHPDLDHLGGLFHILDNFEVGRVFHNGREAAKGAKEKWRAKRTEHGAVALVAGDRIDIDGGLRIEVLHPDHDENLKDNGASLILRLACGERGLAIFSGDAEKENLLNLVSNGDDLNARIVFAAHHGSDKNLARAFYEAANPDAVVACCGFMNRWRYPGKKLKKYLADSGRLLFDTGTRGKIKIEFDADLKPTIRSAKEIGR